MAGDGGPAGFCLGRRDEGKLWPLKRHPSVQKLKPRRPGAGQEHVLQESEAASSGLLPYPSTGLKKPGSAELEVVSEVPSVYTQNK